MATENEAGKPPERDPEAFPRWVWLAGAGALLVVGWIFILVANNFHLTAPVVFVCLGYLAGVAAVYTLFRTGAAAATPGEPGRDDASWSRPVGERSELEREKKALLKAIKEAEFDLQMGKLSQADADAMIAAYRAQAIAVIRELDRADGESGSAREEIEREVRARLAVARGSGVKAGVKAAARAGKAGKGKKPPAEKLRSATAPAAVAVAAGDATAEATEAEVVAAAEEQAAEEQAAEEQAAEEPAAEEQAAEEPAAAATAATEAAAAAEDPAAAAQASAGAAGTSGSSAAARASAGAEAADAVAAAVEPRGQAAGVSAAKEATS